MKLIPVIMSGGVGSRLWPVSREAHPKPFIQLPDGENLIGKTFRRACSLANVAEVMTVTNQELFFKTEDDYDKISSCPKSYVLKPFGRNTAAAVTAAALQVQQRHGDDAQILVLAADHLIKDEAAFAQAVDSAQQLASAGWHVTFGIEPEYPETGFGYIEADKSQSLVAGFKVGRFVEKPDLKTAEIYLVAGNYYWNSGMFCFRVGTLVEDLEKHAPDVILHARKTPLASSAQSPDSRVVRLQAELFAKVPSISIDYALMERSDRVAVVPCDIGWSDIGSWNAMSDLIEPDANHNRCDGEVLTFGSTCNYTSSPKRLTALVGVKDLIVVDTDDALLVAHRDQAQDVKEIVAQLKKIQA